MKMNKQIYIIIFFLIFICCKSNQKKEVINEFMVVDSIQNSKKESIDSETFIKIDSTNKVKNNLLIHGELTQSELDKYYPKILDTIKDIRIIGSEKIDLNPGNGILVSLLHNTGTFDQMIICTHNNNFDLIDQLYIGKATDFDNGKSHTIEYTIYNNEIIFNQVDWGYVTKNNEEEIDTVKYEKLNISINKSGEIKYKKTILKNGHK